LPFCLVLGAFKKVMTEDIDNIVAIHEDKIAHYQREKEELTHKIRFLSDHKFQKEADWNIQRRDAILEVLFDYRKIVED